MPMAASALPSTTSLPSSYYYANSSSTPKGSIASPAALSNNAMASGQGPVGSAGSSSMTAAASLAATTLASSSASGSLSYSMVADPTGQSGRAKGVTIVKPIVYGNVARYFGKKREEDGHTHQWTLYVKPYRNEDMSVYVKKIHFKLHESYANPNRVVTKPPYEVTETGWGEFEVVVKIYFQDPNERAVTLYHILKLFQTGPDMMLGKKTLVSEFYEEMVFHEPTVPMQHLLTASRQLTLGLWKHDTDFEEKQKQTLAAIVGAKAKIRAEITSLKDHLTLAKETIHSSRERIAQAQANPGSIPKLIQPPATPKASSLMASPTTQPSPAIKMEDDDDDDDDDDDETLLPASAVAHVPIPPATSNNNH